MTIKHNLQVLRDRKLLYTYFSIRSNHEVIRITINESFFIFIFNNNHKLNTS